MGDENYELKRLLNQAGLKNTHGRMAIMGLLQSEGPLSHEEIMTKLSGVAINRVTIYRALDSFVQAGIAHRVGAGDRVWKFALCGHHHHHIGHCHPHFVCKSCGKIECMDAVKLPPITGFKDGYTVEESEFYLKGRCARCIVIKD